MKRIAACLLGAACVLCIFAVFFDVGVESGDGRIANLNLMHQQSMLLITSGFLFLGGLMLLVGSMLKDGKRPDGEVQAGSWTKKWRTLFPSDAPPPVIERPVSARQVDLPDLVRWKDFFKK